MSLVAYISSDEGETAEAEPEPEEEEAAAPTPRPTLGALFPSLPAPKGPALLPPPPPDADPSLSAAAVATPAPASSRLALGPGGFPAPPGVCPAEAAGGGEALGVGLPHPEALASVCPPHPHRRCGPRRGFRSQRRGQSRQRLRRQSCVRGFRF